ncbi:hypothetical protein IC582_005215 [Cucumis melo]
MGCSMVMNAYRLSISWTQLIIRIQLAHMLKHLQLLYEEYIQFPTTIHIQNIFFQ